MDYTSDKLSALLNKLNDLKQARSYLERVDHLKSALSSSAGKFRSGFLLSEAEIQIAEDIQNVYRDAHDKIQSAKEVVAAELSRVIDAGNIENAYYKAQHGYEGCLTKWDCAL